MEYNMTKELKEQNVGNYFLINSAVLTQPGIYKYTLVDLEEAVKWLKNRPFKSFVGYEITAKQIAEYAGVNVPVCRKSFSMNPGDEALVVRLKYRIQEPTRKGAFVPNFPDDYEFGILRHLGE